MESAIRVDANIKLQIAVFSTTAVSLNVSYRERINGVTKQPREANIASSRITTNAAANYFYYQFYGDTGDVSELLNVAVGLATSGVQRGQCFVRVGLTIGGVDGSAKDPFQILFSDYVTSNSYVAYPGSLVVDSLSGRGYFNNSVPMTIVTNEATYANAANILSNIHSVSMLYTASVAVANRYPRLLWEDSYGGNKLLTANSSTAITASQVKDITFASYGANTALTGFDTIALPSNIFFSGDESINISCVNADAGDAVANAYISIEQWIKA